MQILNSEFIVSNTDVDKCPKNSLPEYAFIGRSNVGKSSLINMICGRKNLAKISSAPGKTKLINHFLINKSWHIVDLPGYGYARTSKAKRKEFEKFITTYFLKRKELTCAFLLLDIRLKPQLIDINFIKWLGEKLIPFSIVFTKSDKINPDEIKLNISKCLGELKKDWAEIPPYFITSATKLIGRKEILDYIKNTNKEIKQEFNRKY